MGKEWAAASSWGEAQLHCKKCVWDGRCCCGHHWTCSWPLNEAGVWGADPLHNQNSMYNFWLPQNFTNSLLLSRSLINTINSWLTHTSYIIYVGILYCILTSQRKETLAKKIIRKRKYVDSTVCVYCKKFAWVDLHRSNPLFKCQLYPWTSHTFEKSTCHTHKFRKIRRSSSR